MVNIFNLPRWNVTAVKENAHDYRVEATIPEEAPGYCGAMFAAYEAWERSITDRELLPAFRPLLTAMLNWRTEIFAYWDHRHTNALNGIAKGVERAGRGYSFDVIRAKLLYSLHKTRKPKYGEGDFGRGVEPPSLGTDVGRLLEAEARRLE